MDWEIWLLIIIILAIIVIFWFVVIKILQMIFTGIKNPYVAIAVALIFLWFVFG